MMLRSFAVLAILAGFSGMVAAGPFGVFGRRGGGNSGQQTGGQGGGEVGSAQGVANLIARTGIFRHWGGNAGYEGIGMGSTPYAAEMSCCYRNRFQPREVGVAQMSNGMFVACCRY
jgi:hypothetical protein